MKTIEQSLSREVVQDVSKVVSVVIREIERQRKLRYEATRTKRSIVEPVSEIIIKGEYGRREIYTALRGIKKRLKSFGIKSIDESEGNMSVKFDYGVKRYCEIDSDALAKLEKLEFNPLI